MNSHSAGHAAVATLTPTKASDYLALTKPRLNLLVIVTAAVGYYLGAARNLDLNLWTMVQTIGGTALVAGGSAAFNQLWERRVDALMERTRHRPLAGGRLSTREAFWFATTLSVAGLAWLALATNWLATGIALLTLLTYVVLYTPLKLLTSFSTVVGAIPGALPPMIGWVAATNSLSREGWILFAIVFFWQMPHFLAIAWLCREDYSRAGFPLLPVIEPNGRSTAYHVATYASALIPVSLTPALTGMAGPTYFLIALLLGLAFLYFSLRFAFMRTRRDARSLFLASITYLPLLLGALLFDHT